MGFNSAFKGLILAHTSYESSDDSKHYFTTAAERKADTYPHPKRVSKRRTKTTRAATVNGGHAIKRGKQALMA
jgi:hypothetical protein